MKNHKNKYNILPKTIAMVVVCLFLVSDIVWAYPDNTSQNSTLARWSAVQVLSDNSVNDPMKVMLEAVTGIEFLAKGKPVRVVNSMLTKSAHSVGTQRKTEFLEDVQKTDSFIKARFEIAGGKNKIFEILLENDVVQINKVGMEYKRKYTYPAGNFEATVTNPNNNYCRTSEGAISVGMSMLFRQLYPNKEDYPSIFIAPQGSWIGKDGTNLMQIYFAIACNFFIHKRKTKIVCATDQKDRIIRYLQLGNPYEFLGPHPYLSKELINRFRREAIYLADRAQIDGVMRMVNPYPDMIEFEEFDDTGMVTLGNVKIQVQEGKFLVEDLVNKSKVILIGNNMEELHLDFTGINRLSSLPEFGLVCLGTSSGMDSNGLSTNHVVCAGDKHILVDMGVHTRDALQALGIADQITHVVITHVHEDHVAGALSYMYWCKENNKPIRLIIEPGIYEFFVKQAETILHSDINTIFKNIEIIPLKFYENTVLGKGGNAVVVESIPAFHGTPATMLRITYKGETISLSGDTTYDLARFEKIVNNAETDIPPYIREDLKSAGIAASTPVFDHSRSEELKEFLFKENSNGKKPALVLHEAGTNAPKGENVTNHTTPFEFDKLTPDLAAVTVVNHTAGLPKGQAFSIKHAAPMRVIPIISGKDMNLSEGASLPDREQKILFVENKNEKDLFTKSTKYLESYPVNMRIDLTPIPGQENQLEQNMETLARLIAWHNTFGFNIRYVFENDSRDNKALGVLRGKIAELAKIPGINTEELLSRIGTPHVGDNVIEIVLRSIENVKAMQQVGDREFVVALKDDLTKEGVSIPNYTAASAIGLSLASLRIAKETKMEEYDRLKNKVFRLIKSIYERCNIITKEDGFTLDDLEFMVTGCPENKLYYAILYALPPIAKDLIERIGRYHETLHLILQSA